MIIWADSPVGRTPARSQLPSAIGPAAPAAVAATISTAADRSLRMGTSTILGMGRLAGEACALSSRAGRFGDGQFSKGPFARSDGPVNMMRSDIPPKGRNSRGRTVRKETVTMRRMLALSAAAMLLIPPAAPAQEKEKKEP